MSESGEKEHVDLADTDAVVEDEDGETRVKMAALSKGGEDEDDENV